MQGTTFEPMQELDIDSVFSKYGELSNQEEVDKSIQVGLIISALKSLQKSKSDAFSIGLTDPN